MTASNPLRPRKIDKSVACHYERVAIQPASFARKQQEFVRPRKRIIVFLKPIQHRMFTFGAGHCRDIGNDQIRFGSIEIIERS